MELFPIAGNYTSDCYVLHNIVHLFIEGFNNTLYIICFQFEKLKEIK